MDLLRVLGMMQASAAQSRGETVPREHRDLRTYTISELIAVGYTRAQWCHVCDAFTQHRVGHQNHLQCRCGAYEREVS